LDHLKTSNRVFLVGMMASGKTTVGRLLARCLGWPFLDNDALLASHTGARLVEVAQKGEEYLHSLEVQIACELCKTPGPFVATVAASVVETATCRLALKESGFVAYLKAEPDLLARRAAGTERPWLDSDPAAWFSTTLRRRSQHFEEIADIVLDASQPADQLASQLCQAIFEQQNAQRATES
jgi:shikimate kinase